VPATIEHRCMACRGLFASENELVMHSESFHKEKSVASTVNRTPKAELNITTK
jgi:hypothetical protein